MQHDMTVRLTGTQPLLMANGQLVDPLNEWTKLIDTATKKAKKAKTDTAMHEADKLRWLGEVYRDDEGYPTLPIDNFLACLIRAAKLHKLGTKAQAGIYVFRGSRLFLDDEVDGKTVDEIVDLPQYTHRKRTRRGVIANRPIFNTWSVEYDLMYDDAIIDSDDVQLILDTAGRVGIGAWTARFGKFNVEVLTENADAAKVEENGKVAVPA